MAVAGTNTRERIDSTTGMGVERWMVAVQKGACVRIRSGMHRILSIDATLAEFVAEPAQISTSLSSDKKTANIFSTSAQLVAVYVAIWGE